MAPEESQMDTFLQDAWDYKSCPASRSTTGGWTGAALILGVETCERLTTVGIAVNLVTYLTRTMHLGNAISANIVTNFLGTSYILCLLGGFVADTFFGRYLNIAIFATVQGIVSTLFSSTKNVACIVGEPSCIAASGMQLAVLYTALYLTALGTGGLKSSVSGFGSDQFDETDKEERTLMTNFFSWFFFFINIGSLAAVTVFVYIQDKLGRPWGYGLCACAIVIGLLVFLSGTKRYRFKKLTGSPLTQIACVCVGAWRKRHMEIPLDLSRLHNGDDIENEDGEKETKPKLPHSKQFLFLDRAALTDNKDESSGSKIHVMSKWYLSSLTDVEEVKQVIKMLPIWATTIMFWTIYAQMTTFSVSQATTMNRQIGKSFKIPAASLSAFTVGSILITVPVYDAFITPVARKILKNPQGVTPLQRIGVGLVLSILAMVVAALTEIKRLNVAKSHDLVNDPAAILPMSVFWLIPQFFLTGSGEAFMYTGQLDFFLRECPKGMKTISTGLFLSTLSLGSFLSSILVTIVHMVTGANKPWLANNLNQGKLYNFYWLLAIMNVFNLGIYLLCAKWYKYNDRSLTEGIVAEDTETCHA
ncbi:hypothetical protein ACET3Z_028995 [Daucus carota]